MNDKPRISIALALLLAFASTGLHAKEQRSARNVRPSYSHERVERNEAPAPQAAPLPDSLRIAVPRTGGAEVERRRHEDGAARTRRPGTPADPARLDSRAREAAAWAAVEAIDRYGRARYFKVGFHQGQRDAFRRTRHDPWEFSQGRRHGRFDPDARRLGDEVGYEEALLASAEEAQRLVREQFADLSREPLPLPAPPPPHFSADGFAVAEPQLHELFNEMAWRGRGGGDLRGLRLDPWRLYQAGRHADFYRGDWRTAAFGFDLWRKRHGRSGWARHLDREQWRLFESSFSHAFESELARRFAPLAERTFDRGYNAGWRHGIRIGREWQYRRGYHQGFEIAVGESARAAFAAGFRSAWAAAYAPLFREWSTTVKLETRAARLRDGNDDGIFEPGEEVYAELDLVNLGGGSGRLEARLRGAALEPSGPFPVDLPRRSPVRRLGSLRAVVSGDARPRTDSLLTVSIGEFSESLPLRVSHVLRFDGTARLARHDVLSGTAAVDVRVANASRRPVFASLDASLDAGFRPGLLREPHRELREIPAGAVRSVRFEAHQVHPLDLVGGELVIRIASRAGGRPQDRLEARLPELATDLSDSSLVDYLLWLARSREADRAEVSRAQGLMLRRLEADWRSAVRANGNPYKSDLRKDAGSTALGELVAAAGAVGGPGVDRSVFTELVPQIEELSRSLPGTHPFLRRSMRNLGRQLL